MTTTKTKLIPLLVTTKHKGVFFGHGVETDANTITLQKVQMCIYWSSDCKGVFGLAANGPTKTCKIGRPVLSMTIQDVTAIAVCTAEAVAAWEKQPWA